MHEHGPHAFCLNLRAYLGNAIESLCTESAGKVAKKDKQDGRFVNELEQRPASLGTKLAKGVCEIRRLSGPEHPCSHPSTPFAENVDYRRNWTMIGKEPGPPVTPTRTLVTK